MNTPDKERIQKWIAGYRKLSERHLDTVVHTACTPVSEIAEDTFAYLDVADVEYMVARIAELEAALAPFASAYLSREIHMLETPSMTPWVNAVRALKDSL